MKTVKAKEGNWISFKNPYSGTTLFAKEVCLPDGEEFTYTEITTKEKEEIEDAEAEVRAAINSLPDKFFARDRIK